MKDEIVIDLEQDEDVFHDENDGEKEPVYYMRKSSVEDVDFNFELDDSKPYMPWDRMPGETLTEYNYFQAFCDVPRKRTLANAYAFYLRRAYGDDYPLPATLTNPMFAGASRKWKWRDRAFAYDRWKRNEEAKDAREVRRAALEQFTRIVTAAAETFNPEEKDISLNSLTKAFAVLLDQSRSEHNELPVRKTATTDTEGKAIETDPAKGLSQALRMIEIAKQRKQLTEEGQK